MKKYLIILFLGLTLNAFGQNKSSVTQLDENTIVKDVSGTLLTYEIWQKLLHTGDYQLRRPQGATEFTIYKMSAEERARAEERKKSQMGLMPKPRQAASLKEGAVFKGEKLTDINGNKYDLKVLNGKTYVINFWFINCPPCKQEIPELNQMLAKYKENKDVIFIAIALDDKTDLNRFLKTNTFNYNIVADGKYYSEKYGIEGFPTHVVVGKDGLIKFSTIGLTANTVYWIDKTVADQLKGI